MLYVSFLLYSSLFVLFFWLKNGYLSQRKVINNEMRWNEMNTVFLITSKMCCVVLCCVSIRFVFGSIVLFVLLSNHSDAINLASLPNRIWQTVMLIEKVAIGFVSLSIYLALSISLAVYKCDDTLVHSLSNKSYYVGSIKIKIVLH